MRTNGRLGSQNWSTSKTGHTFRYRDMTGSMRSPMKTLNVQIQKKPAPFISRGSNSQPRWSQPSRMARLSRWDQTTRSITTALMRSILRHRAVSLKTLNNQSLGRKVRFFGRAFHMFFQNRAITLENSPKNPYSPTVALKNKIPTEEIMKKTVIALATAAFLSSSLASAGGHAKSVNLQLCLVSRDQQSRSPSQWLVVLNWQ